MMRYIKDELTKIVEDQYHWLNPSEQDELVAKTLRRLAYRIERGFKTCVTCQEDKQPIHFPQDRSTRDGLAARCRPCDRQRYKDRKETNTPTPIVE